MTESTGPYRRWMLAARPRTLPAALVPVAVGASLVRPASIEWLNSSLCVVVALALQIGTNYANDYSDGVRGTDHERVGPFRLTASHLVRASSVRNASFAFFALAGVTGLILASRSTWWLVAIGASAILAGWFYTGGPRPYGYYGFGEFFVLLYFGFVATVGTTFVQHRNIPSAAWSFGVATGFMACALLESNNLRDIENDQKSHKRTLAARLGRTNASWLYVGCVVGIIVGLATGGEALVALFALVIFLRPLRWVFSARAGRALLPLLKETARAQVALGAVLVVTFFVTR